MKNADDPSRDGPRPGWLEQLRLSQESFRSFIESCKMPDIAELIREEREKRDEQILEAVGVANQSNQRDSPCMAGSVDKSGDR